MSREEMHKYVSKHISWQMGFGLINVTYEGNRPRWDVEQVEVMFDKRNRPYFHAGGKWFQ
jgi:hypothetical protein